MITGFLFISKLLKDQGCTDWFKLFESRIFRIFPLYMFALFIISLVVFFSSDFKLLVEPLELLREYLKWFLFYGWDINGFPQTNKIIAQVDWTLKYEWLFYLSLPLISLVIKSGKTITYILIISCLILFIFPFKLIGIKSIYFVLFGVGGVCSYLRKSKLPEYNFFTSRLASFISLIALVCSLFIQDSFSLQHVVVMAIFFFIVSMGNDMFGLFRKRASILLGEISYSIYLLHGIILYFCFTIFDYFPLKYVGMDEYLLFMIPLCILVIFFSTLTYLIIELPFINYGRRYFFSKKIRKWIGT